MPRDLIRVGWPRKRARPNERWSPERCTKYHFIYCKEDDAPEDLSALMEGGAVPREELDVAYDSSGEAHRLANKVAPNLTRTLLKQAEEAIRGAPVATNKATQDVEGDSNDLSVDLP